MLGGLLLAGQLLFIKVVGYDGENEGEKIKSKFSFNFWINRFDLSKYHKKLYLSIDHKMYT